MGGKGQLLHRWIRNSFRNSSVIIRHQSTVMCSFYDSASFRRGLYPDEWSTPLTASSSSTHPAHFTERARVQSGQQSAMVGSTDAYQRELDAESRLALIQRRARRDVCKIKALFILLSLVCVALTWPANLASMDPSLPREWAWLLSFQPLGIFFLVLAVHPQDRIMVRIFFFTFMMVGFLCGPIICIPQGIGKIWTVECANTTISPQNFLHGPSVSSPDIYCITYINLFLVQFVGCLLMGCGSLKAVQCTNGCKEWKMTAYAAYRRVFFVGRAASVIWGTGFVVGGIILAPTGPEELRVYHLALIVFGTELILFAAIMTPRFIQRLHGWVAKVATRGEAREAAGVAALMGKYGPAKTLRIAKEHFRGIDFADLSEIDFTDNGDSGLHVKTQKSRLGSLDAFMSHSWRDPAKPKFAALSKWAKAFQGRTGRHPTLWLDKVSAHPPTGAHSHAQGFLHVHTSHPLACFSHLCFLPAFHGLPAGVHRSGQHRGVACCASRVSVWVP